MNGSPESEALGVRHEHTRPRSPALTWVVVAKFFASRAGRTVSEAWA
jgi:hypothetical protein